MSDLISRAALFNALADAKDVEKIFAIIQTMPSIDEQPEGELTNWDKIRGMELEEFAREFTWLYPCTKCLQTSCCTKYIDDCSTHFEHWLKQPYVKPKEVSLDDEVPVFLSEIYEDEASCFPI